MGAHWASDVLAGYALGFAYLLVIIELYRAWQKRHPKA
jgi:membrane-associated phospholipid phosphatase